MKPNHSPLRRIYHACLYSWDGLVAAVRDEAAFRQELLLFALLLIPLWLLPLPPATKLLLFSAQTAVLVVELLNSAIEAVVDAVSPEVSSLAKKAKDMGSAAVLLCLLLTALLWAVALINLFSDYA